MSRHKRLLLDCGSHGKRIATVVCKHLLGSDSPVAGFVENSDDPDDLQAWCHACEAKFQEEGKMSKAFREFTGMSLVCDNCYADAKVRHSIPES